MMTRSVVRAVRGVSFSVVCMSLGASLLAWGSRFATWL